MSRPLFRPEAAGPGDGGAASPLPSPGPAPGGLVAALPAEARTLSRARLRTGRCARSDDGLLIVQSGMGRDAARTAARRLVEAGAGALVSWGTAGGLAPGLGCGTLVVADGTLGQDGRQYACDAELASALLAALADTDIDYLQGTVLDTEDALPDSAAKLAAHQATSALAVDMESHAVAAVACDAGLPFLAVRAVVDTAHTSLPATALQAVDDSGHLRPLALVRGLAIRPVDIPALMQLGRDFARACESLRTAATALPSVFQSPGGL